MDFLRQKWSSKPTLIFNEFGRYFCREIMESNLYIKRELRIGIKLLRWFIESCTNYDYRRLILCWENKKL
jgi:hypothetical protein